MMGVFMMSQTTGPLGGKLAPSGSSSKSRRTSSCCNLGLATTAQRQTWQTVLSIIPLLFASTAAYNESYLAATYQTPPGTRPGSSDSLPFQNVTDGQQLTRQDLQNWSDSGQPRFPATGRDLYTSNLLASTAGTVDWSFVANTQWDSSNVSGNIELNISEQGPLNIGSTVLKMDQNSSNVLELATSLTPDSTSISLKLASKGVEQLEITTAPPSLISQAVGIEKMETAYTIRVTPTLSPVLSLPDMSSSLQLDPNTTHQHAPAFRNTAATDQPTAAGTVVLTSRNPLALEHIPRVAQGLRETSSTEMVYKTSISRIMAEYAGTATSPHSDFLSDQYRKTLHTSHQDSMTSSVGTTPPGTSHQDSMTSSVGTTPPGTSHQDSMTSSVGTTPPGTSHQDSMTSSVGTTPPGTTNIGMKFLHPSSGHASHSSLASTLHTPANTLPGPSSHSSGASSHKADSEPTIVSNGQKLDTTESVSRGPPAAVPVTLSPSSLWPSLSHSNEALPAVTLPAFTTLAGSTGSRKSRGFPTPQQPELLSTGFSPHRPIPTTTESPYVSSLSAAADGAHVNPENYTEIPLNSVFPYWEGKGTIPPIHSLPSTADLTSSSSQPTMTESTMNRSLWSKARNPTLPISHSLTAESSADVAHGSVNKLTLETTTHIPHSSADGEAAFSLSLATMSLGLGTHAETGLSVGSQSSRMKEQVTPLPPSLSTTEEDSLATLGVISTSAGEEARLDLKEDPSHVPQELIGFSEVSTHGTISNSKSGMTNFGITTSPWQVSSSSLGTLHAGDAETGYNVSPLEGVTNTASYREQMAEPHKITAAAQLMPMFSSEVPVMALGGTPAEDLVFSLTSAESPVQLTDEHYALPRRRSGSMPTPPPNSTSLVTSRVVSKEPSEPETLTMSLTTKMANDSIVHTFTARSDSMRLSSPHLETAEATLPNRDVSDGMVHVDLSTGDATTRSAEEFLSVTSQGWKLAIPTSSHATASHGNITESGRFSVIPTRGSVSTSFISMGSSRSSVPESILKINDEATEGLMSRWKEQGTPTNTMLPVASTAEAWTHDLKAIASSQTAANTTDTLLPTRASEVDFSASAVATTLGTILGYKITDAFTAAVPQVVSTMALHTGSSGVESSTASQGPAYLSFPESTSPAYLSLLESTSTQAVPVSSVTTDLLTSPRILPGELTRAACRNAPCTVSTIPASFTLSQGASTQIPTTTQALLTRKLLVTPLGSTDAMKNGASVVLGTTETSPEHIISTTTQMVSGNQKGNTPKQPVSKFKAPSLSQFTRKESLTWRTSTPPVLAVHNLPLWFRLIGIDYEESLENKSSQSYKKLEKEVKLTLNKMLSTYETFLQANVLHFLNGSVIAEAVAVFQAGGPVPTPSDVIRTIVTEVERREMDTFFGWRVDVKSLQSNGFSWKNLEPEKLAVSFTVLGLGSSASFDGMMNLEHMEKLRRKVFLLLGTQYTVQNISLNQVRYSQGGVDINGEVYIDTNAHVDIGWALKALMGLRNYSVDLTSLSINGSRLSLQVFPVSFLVTNRIFNERMMDRSSVEHQNLARDISDVLMHILGKYKNLLQVAIRDITGGSLICHGDVIFQHPAPTSKDVLQTLALSVGPKDYLDSSNLQVDPFSFTVAGDGLEPPVTHRGVPGYVVAIIVLCVLALVALPILALLRKVLGRRDKIIINRGRDHETGVETFELDNPGFHPTRDEVYSRLSEHMEK
ncbi:mucin-6-like [Lacerta agilis]|uniref:mucin-6-like n=1 Tax=Lacerta agilis TaxID=80427 RepID=UPI001419ECB9|nr:mucin-6-like [Lacerta agilis]